MKASSNGIIRVVIIDKQTMIRVGLRLIVDNHPEMSVVGEAEETKEALEIVAYQKPDVILLKVNSDGNLTPEIIPTLLKESNQSRILLITSPDESEWNSNALKHGALGIVFKTQKPEILIKAIQKVHAGEAWVERSLIAEILYDIANDHRPVVRNPDMEHIAELTDREQEVIQLIGRGFKNQQIANHLCLSETTVRHHLTSIYSKLEVSNRLELLVFANRHNLV